MAKEIENSNGLTKNIEAYKKKVFLNQFIRNTLIFITLFSFIYLIINSIEFSFHLNATSRTVLFYLIFLGLILAVFWILLRPLIKYALYERFMTDEEAGKQIGKLFPEIGDKVLNTIQLSSKSSENKLISATLSQRISQLSVFTFSSGIDYRKNLQYAKYAVLPISTIIIILLLIPNFLTESTSRIINYDKEYSHSLFDVQLKSDLSAFRNEILQVDFNISGQAIPDYFDIHWEGRTQRMSREAANLTYTFPKVNEDLSFYISSGAFKSQTYKVEVKQRPEMKDLKIHLDFPSYTRLSSKEVNNNGNLIVPEGTLAKWEIGCESAEEIHMIWPNDSMAFDSQSSGHFKAQSILNEDSKYEIKLENTYSQNKEPIVYKIDVIKDKYPEINVNVLRDTTLYQFLLFEGRISDDYGFKQMQLVYTYRDQSYKQKVDINPFNSNQKFFCQLNLDSINLSQGESIQYYLSILDNDEINGYKETRSQVLTFQIPDKNTINEDIEKRSAQAKSEMNNIADKAKEIREQIENIREDIKKQNGNSWQEKKKINQLIENKEELEKEINELVEKHKELTEKQNKFKNPNPQLQEKAQQLQKLMDEMLDEETKKLYDELKKLLEEQNDPQELSNTMEDLAQKEKNLEDELERALEMFKRMQFEYKIDETINELSELQEKQEKLSEQTKDKSNSLEDIKKEQEEINSEFDQIEEQMDEMSELNEQLKHPENMQDLSEEENSINEKQDEISEELNKENRKKSSQNQKDAADQMKSMQQKMQNMQAGMQMEMMQENLDHLRDILDNLIKLSFDQEQLMVDFEDVNQSDPRFVSLSQKQLKLRDDAVIIQDSLKSLADRVFQIQSFVTRELNEMNRNIEASLQSLKDRKKAEAVANQQYTMTAINNLSLLLNDVLKQMQSQMAESMGMPQKGQKGKKQNMPDLSQLQKQLNNKIEELKKSGKTGRPLSQELAELAAEQEMIRQQMQQIQDDLNQANDKDGLSKNLQEIIKKMEETETDLVNKNIKQETIRRQQDILNRMLESEDSLREREKDNQREAEVAKDRAKQSRKKFEEYRKAKESELELLQTLPPKMNPYYKEEVNKYFKRLNEQ